MSEQASGEAEKNQPTRVVIEQLIATGMSRDAAVAHLQRQIARGEWSLDDRLNVVSSPETSRHDA